MTTSDSLPVTLLGIGAMGTAIAKVFLKAGHPTTVWNRSAERAVALAGEGARVASAPNEAVRAADLVIVCVLDYPAAREILSAAGSALHGKTVVNFTTGRPSEARAMQEWVAGFGASYLDGGLMATPSMIGLESSLILYSGNESAFQRWQPVFSRLGQTNYLGSDPGLAALLDMSLLSGMYGLFAGFFHAVALGASGGISVDALTARMKPWFGDILGFLDTYAEQIRTGNYSLNIDANLQVHTTALANILRASREQGVRDDMLAPLLAIFQKRLAAGHAREDISGVVELIGQSGETARGEVSHSASRIQDLRGKNAVVIGGTHGMGLAMARTLLERGARVVFTGRNEANLSEARSKLGDAAIGLRSDISNLGEIKLLGDAVGREFGRVDALFINAGVSELAPVEQVTEDSYDRMFGVNTKGAFFTAQGLAPYLADGGSIVFTTVTPCRGTPAMSVYFGTKGAVSAMARAMAAELLPRRIRVNCVAPGFIATPTMGVAGLSEEDRVALMQTGDEITPMKRHGTAEEVAQAALFLAFDATFSTGVELPVDGGLASVETPA